MSSLFLCVCGDICVAFFALDKVRLIDIPRRYASRDCPRASGRACAPTPQNSRAGLASYRSLAWWRRQERRPRTIGVSTEHTSNRVTQRRAAHCPRISRNSDRYDF